MRCRLRGFAKNRGQSGARNAGLLAATGDLIAFLDADDLWEPTKLEKQVKLITRETQLVYSGLTRFESISGKSLSVAYPNHKGACRNRFVENPGVAVVVGGESTVLLTHELVIKVGEFDPNLNISAGWDFFRRCSAHTNFDYVPELLTRYRIHEGNMSKNSTNMIQDIRKSFFKLVASDCQALSLRHLLRAYLRLEWSFYKTHLRNHSLKDSLIGLAKFPFYLYSFLWNYKLGDL